MGEQTIESKFNENGVQNTETVLHEKQSPMPSRMTESRDFQIENVITVSESMESPPLSKEKGPTIDSSQICGTKRTSPGHQSPSTNGHLAYVRRKVAKSSPIDSKIINHSSDSSCLNQLGETKLSSIPAVAPLPKESLMSYSSAKPSIPLHPGKFSDSIPSSVGTTTMRENRLHWEARAFQLKRFLSKLDHSNQDDYLQELRSLSSAELSRHAVKLEKRTIQLALEEGKEMDRVMFLNILGKPD